MPQIIKNGQTPEYYFEERCHIAELLNNQDCPGLNAKALMDTAKRINPGDLRTQKLIEKAKK